MAVGWKAAPGAGFQADLVLFWIVVRMACRTHGIFEDLFGYYRCRGHRRRIHPPQKAGCKMELSVFARGDGLWCPRFTRLEKHNHLSMTFQFNTRDDALGREILEFIKRGR